MHKYYGGGGWLKGKKYKMKVQGKKLIMGRGKLHLKWVNMP